MLVFLLPLLSCTLPPLHCVEFHTVLKCLPSPCDIVWNFEVYFFLTISVILSLQEINEMKASIEKSYSEQLQELHQLVEVKQKDLEVINKSFSEQKHAMVDLNERLTAYSQSIAEAKEIMDR